MRVPRIGKPRTASSAFSLSRKLPKLQLPPAAASSSALRPHPKYGRPGRSVAASLTRK